MFDFLKKRPPPPPAARKKPAPRSRELTAISQKLGQVSTRDDIDRILKAVQSSRQAIIKEIRELPAEEELADMMVKQITAPLKGYLAELSSNQAVKQQMPSRLSGSQAPKSLDQVVGEMKQKMEMLTPRHLRVLGVLAQKREEWLGYEEIGAFCVPALSGSCIRGYVADLINVYRIPLEKQAFGKQSRVRLPEQVFKQLAISKLAD
ncbi:MAG: hypothetical protein HY520_04645 [Candidatus Aenigmarchaeota archaeon]|nr:hypothetical protein [Candidatus Aenigmarchaeota archaeon]